MLELINNESLVVVRLMYNFIIIMIFFDIYIVLCMLIELCRTFVVLIFHLKQSKDFIVGLFCELSNRHLFYLKSCIFGKCDICGNFSLLGECMYEISLHECGQ